MTFAFDSSPFEALRRIIVVAAFGAICVSCNGQGGKVEKQAAKAAAKEHGHDEATAQKPGNPADCNKTGTKAALTSGDHEEGHEKGEESHTDEDGHDEKPSTSGSGSPTSTPSTTQNGTGSKPGANATGCGGQTAATPAATGGKEEHDDHDH